MVYKKHPAFESYFVSRLASSLEETSGKKVEAGQVGIPPPYIGGDLTISIGNPREAEKLASRIKRGELVSEVSTAGPFVNIILNKDAVYREVLGEVTKLGANYGASDGGKGKTISIEYSSPNVAKPIGVGHLRSTIIGEALVRLYQHTGYKVIRENYLGDWGTQFGKLIYAYQKWGDEEKVKENPIEELKQLYVRFQKESEQNEKLNEEGRSIFKRLEEEDKELLGLWKKFRDMSIEEFKRVYGRLGITFDVYGGESVFVKDAENLVETCLEKDMCSRGEGDAVVALLPGIPSFLLRKQDGATLYLTRDLAALRYRIRKYKPNILLYVVVTEQTLHFKQLFALAERLGYLDGTEARHIPFGLVLKDGKRMATRKGTAVELTELLNQAVEKSRTVIEEKNPGLSDVEKEKVSEMVGIGAILYNDLKQSRRKDVSFDWERMLNFELGSAVYLQYTYARINSLIGKATERFGKKWRKAKNSVWEDKREFGLARQIMFFPVVVRKAQRRDEPHLIPSYLEELARGFNGFYNDTSVIRTEDEKLRDSRILLTASVGAIVKNGLELLNIKVPERM